MSGDEVIIILGSNQTPKSFVPTHSATGFRVTNTFPDTATVHYVADSGNEDGSDIGITTSSSIVLGAGTLSGVA